MIVPRRNTSVVGLLATVMLYSFFKPVGQDLPAYSTNLPSPDTKRWVMRHKAVVVGAVRKGVISLDEVCRRYNISIEGFLTGNGWWMRMAFLA